MGVTQTCNSKQVAYLKNSETQIAGGREVYKEKEFRRRATVSKSIA